MKEAEDELSLAIMEEYLLVLRWLKRHPVFVASYFFAIVMVILYGGI